VRVFLDTNVLVSAFTTRGLSADLYRLVLAEHELLTGEVNLSEFRRVLRERFRAPASEVDWVEEQLRQHTIIPKPTRPSELPIRDPDDAWVLASALAGAAAILVTGDRDLLSLAEVAPIRIVDTRSCWELLRGLR
jgi:putative PIN family toxin of toxin-antitoxin system